MSIDINEIDSYYISLILKEAKKAYYKNEVPVAACVVQFNSSKHQLISLSHNLKETDCDVTSHAEILSIRQAAQKLNNWRLLNCTLYTTLEPCIMCAGAIIHSRIERVVFCAYDFKWGGFGSQFNVLKCKGLNHYTRCEYHADEFYKKLLKRFFKMRRS